VNSPYSVPKHEGRIEVRISALGVERLLVFLGDGAAHHQGPELLVDLLAEPDDFLPVKNEAGEVSFLRGDSISVITCDPALAGCARPAPELDTVLRVAVTLEDGRVLEGAVRYQLPESARRLQDYLNLPDRFVALESEDRFQLVNKRAIVRVTPI
jgi:hypothetical protein